MAARRLAPGRLLGPVGRSLHLASCAQSRSHSKPVLYRDGERCGRVRAVRRRHDLYALEGVEEGRRWVAQRRRPRIRLVMD
jgi:hypothetical protein